MADQDLLISDRALAVFAFAAYHELESGQVVRSVARRDDAGHKADDAAVDELQKQGYIEADENFIRFTASGERLKQSVIDGLHKAVIS
jgi:hypothetical protein